MHEEIRPGDVDLTLVVPERRETVRERIAALEAYEALPRRTSGDLQRLSEPLDLSPASFYRLWRSWRLLRDPRTLQGPTRARGLKDPVGDRAYVRGLLETLVPAGSTESQVLAIEALAERDGVAVRSRSALRRLVREFREEDASPPLAGSSAGTVALDMVPLEIAVDHDGALQLPLAAVILHPRSGSALSVLLSTAAATPMFARSAVARWLMGLQDRADGTLIDTLLSPASDDAGWSDMFEILRRGGVARTGPDAARMPAGVVVAGALGRRVLDLDVRPRMIHRAPEDRRPLSRSTRLARPLRLEEAQAVVDERVAVAAKPPLFLPSARALASELLASTSARRPGG